MKKTFKAEDSIFRPPKVRPPLSGGRDALSRVYTCCYLLLSEAVSVKRWCWCKSNNSELEEEERSDWLMAYLGAIDSRSERGLLQGSY